MRDLGIFLGASFLALVICLFVPPVAWCGVGFVIGAAAQNIVAQPRG